MNKEEKQKLVTQYKEAKDYFLYYLKPVYDRAYKLFESYTGDRAEELEKINGQDKTWQSNVFMPLVFSYCKQFLQKTVGVAPDFTIEGVNDDALHEAIETIWEYRMSEDQIDYFLQCFVFGWTIGKDFLTKQTINKFVSDIKENKKGEKIFTRKIKEDKKVFWPDFDPVSVYSFFYNPRSISLNDNTRKFQRYVLSYDQLLEKYTDLDEKTKAKLLNKDGEPQTMGDVSDYEYVKKQVMESTVKSIRQTTKDNTPGTAGSGNIYNQAQPTSEALYEVIEAWRPERREVFIPQGQGGAVMLKDEVNPHDHGEVPYRKVAFFPKPFCMEGIGIPKLLEGLQELVNSDVNKIEDAVSIRLGGLIVAAPSALPGYDQKKSVMVRPMGILWTNDPQSVQFSKFPDIGSSNFLQIEKIREMMRQTVGIDEYSSLTPQEKQTATVASFMREATIEGVKLFLFMLKNAYVGHFEHYISMMKQFWTERKYVPDKILAVLDDYSDVDFPVKDEMWIDDNGEHKLFPGLYETRVDQASTLASSGELRRSHDLRLWETVEKAPDEMIDPETGKIMSIKKWKVLLKVLKNTDGWDNDEYVVEKEAQPTAPQMESLDKAQNNKLTEKLLTKEPVEGPLGNIPKVMPPAVN